ncbi:MBOAT family O-acyltransferase [Desulfosarcina ovata]|uniref:MBOAT family O-acyltransferase n=1 Tax=Desulfosarcina ovata TaxID=83564 RepID=UPI0012D31B63|nr:MBOAT family O-acyltransferase [Desulfosarcina ovata]
MFFNSLTFVLFLTIVYICYMQLGHANQNRLFLISSYIFYGWWDWRFLTLIWLSTLVDYFCALEINETQHAKVKKRILAISIATNLSILGFFKYFNFFIDSTQTLFAFLGWHFSMVTINVVLPVGISFYTFQTMSYTIDVYRGKINPTRNILNFAVYVAFFPQLVAGPIERATRLLPQIEMPRKIQIDDLRKAISFLLWGYFLKIFLADNLAVIVDAIFSQSPDIGKIDVLIGCYAFAFQIYGDFAGYSAIAIGVARLFGFRLMTNFLFPYFVTNPSLFWRNWHISLSNWLRDYLYIPLGGNRKGNVKLYRNLFITMLLGGLWHGAAWNFVLWGGFHGAILSVHRFFSKKSDGALKGQSFSLLKIILMFHVTCFGWLLFRASSLTQIYQMVDVLLTGFLYTPFQTQYWASATGFCCIFPLLIKSLQYRYNCPNDVLGLPMLSRFISSSAIVYLIVCLGNFGTKQFIYFQF